MTLSSPRGLALPPRGGQKNVRGNSRLPTLPRLPRRYEPRKRLNILISLLGGLTWNCGRSRGGVQRRSNTWFRGKNLSTTRLSSTPNSASLSLFFFDRPPLPSRLLSPALIPGGETGEKRGRREREREREERLPKTKPREESRAHPIKRVGGREPPASSSPYKLESAGGRRRMG